MIETCKAGFYLGMRAYRVLADRKVQSKAWLTSSSTTSQSFGREGKNILTQMAAEKPCELVRAVTRVLSSDEVRLRQDAVMVLDCKGMDNPDC